MNPIHQGKFERFEITMDSLTDFYARVAINGEDVLLMRFTRNADGSLDLNVFEMANDDVEIANTYPEFFPEVTQ